MFNLSVKNKLKSLIILPLLLIVVMMVYLSHVYDVLEERDEKNIWLEEVSFLVSQLYMVGYDVVMYPAEERPKQQWKLISDKIAEKLRTSIFLQKHEVEFVDTLKHKQVKLSRLFNRMLYSIDNRKIRTERREQLAKQILIQTQAIKSDIHSINIVNEKYYSEIRNDLIVVLVLIAFFTVLIISLIVSYLYKSICYPLDILKDWSADFVSGHLDKKIDIRSNDEFSALANQFFELGLQLKQNHLELDNEIEERKKSEMQNQMLLLHLDACQQHTGVASLDWQTTYGTLYLTPMSLDILALDKNDAVLGFDDFINLIDKNDQKSALFMLERCRDTGKGFELNITFSAEEKSPRKVRLLGFVSTVAPYKYVNMTIELIE